MNRRARRRALHRHLGRLPCRCRPTRLPTVPRRRAYLDEFDDWADHYVSPFGDLVKPDADRNWDSTRRMRDLEADGIVAEVIYPNTVPPFFPEGWAHVARAAAPRSSAATPRGPARPQPVARRVVRRVPRAPRRRRPDPVERHRRSRTRRALDRRPRICAAACCCRACRPARRSPPMHAPVYDPVWHACAERGRDRERARRQPRRPTTASTRRRCRCG